MDDPRDRRPIALIGLMGAGKSAVARVLGERLGTSVADLDSMIEAEEGQSVAELFERAGEAWFRRRESELLERVISTGVGVVACGGGVVLDPKRREALRERCCTVWLEVEPAEAARRVRAMPGDPAAARPLLQGGAPGDRLAAVLEQRRAWYEEVAHVKLATDGLTPEQVADRILAEVNAGS
jgi:shikimate kinase